MKKPELAAFPKCYMDELCLHRSMSLAQWIDLASNLEVDGLEFYPGFLQDEPEFLRQTREQLQRQRLQMPMLCCSPDFTVREPELLRMEVARQKRMIELTSYFGGRYCRVLSGQRRPGLEIESGIRQVVGTIEGLLPFAEKHGVVLILENHYKDNYWEFPEFAQKMEVFLEIVNRIESCWFGVNYDPSNALLAGEDPLLLLEQVKHKVVTMHASDRYLRYGTLDDLRKEENSRGYADRLGHGVIGQGLNDYDAIFSILSSVGFHSWISIEDGMTGLEDLKASVQFLREKIDHYFKACPPACP